MAPKHRAKTLPPAGWISKVERLVKKDPPDRLKDPAYARSAQIAEHSDDFCSIAVPVIRSLLPADADLATTVYATVLSDPAAFAYRSKVVMNTDAPGYFGQATTFFGVLGHELFHIGYFERQPHQTEVWPDNYGLHVLLITLQNDGLAVYTQHELAEFYPQPTEMNLLLLDSKLAVRYLVSRVNLLLVEAESVELGDPMVTAFNGMSQRALYVVGAHMARTIDEWLGRDVLRETVAAGPRAFIRTYNSVAKPSLQIYEVAEPVELSPTQVVRKAALEDDPDQLRAALGSVASSGRQPGGETFEHLSCAGLVLLSKDRPDLAVEVFQGLVQLFPEHPFAHLHLADAYRLCGDPARAELEYHRATTIEPRIESALAM
jgi:hypothetical protein